MILEVVANPRELDPALDPRGLEHVGVADAGELEDLGRLNSATADYDLSVDGNKLLRSCVHKVDSFRDVALKDDTGDQGFAKNLQI